VESLISEEAFEREELLPYWAELWSSSVALAEAVAARSLRGARTLELGCGLGLPSIAAAAAGGRVVASDWSPDAVSATLANAQLNAVDVEGLVCAWQRPEPLLERGPWDLVLASDVLYERRNAEALLELLPRLITPSGEVLVADPDRPPAKGFLESASQRWEIETRRSPRQSTVSLHRMRLL
jgi:predicted nicotinamide N-methyase